MGLANKSSLKTQALAFLIEETIPLRGEISNTLLVNYKKEVQFKMRKNRL